MPQSPSTIQIPGAHIADADAVVFCLEAQYASMCFYFNSREEAGMVLAVSGMILTHGEED